MPGGRQKGGDWYARAIVRGFTRSHPYERATSVSIEKFQRGTLAIFAYAKIHAVAYVFTLLRQCVPNLAPQVLIVRRAKTRWNGLKPSYSSGFERSMAFIADSY